MKRLLVPLLVGLILLYFVAAAADVKIFSLEMLVRNVFHFLTGFVGMGVWIWHRRKLGFKAALYLVLAIVLAYDIVDYVRNANYLRLEMILHDLYVFMWGAVAGWLYLRQFKTKRGESEPNREPDVPD
ncbi:MAG: hypothetical protein ACPW60_14280 [Methylohalobius sp. ZOD2]